SSPGWQTTRVSLNDLAQFPQVRRVSSKNNDELWPALIEEAYIQQAGQHGELGQIGAFGSVGAHLAGVTHGGYSDVALTTLTGVESQTFAPSQISLAELKQQVDAGNPVVMSTPKNFDTLPQAVALFRGPTTGGDIPITSHAYTVTGVDADHNTVTVRNP